MKMQLFTIFDKKLEAYHQPFCLENENVALRQFQNMAKKESSIADNPEDYSLWHTSTLKQLQVKQKHSNRNYLQKLTSS